MAQLVRLRGPFTSPSVGIDATATAATVARIGAAIGTSGLSVLGETLLSGVTAAKGSPCQLAMSSNSQTATQTQSTPTDTARPANPLAGVLEKLFRR